MSAKVEEYDDFIWEAFFGAEKFSDGSNLLAIFHDDLSIIASRSVIEVYGVGDVTYRLCLPEYMIKPLMDLICSRINEGKSLSLEEWCVS